MYWYNAYDSGGLMTKTLYWFDFETLGINPAQHWPVQFAGIRTDLDLNEIGQPLNLLAKVPTDQLPEPEACLITGITPQRVDTGLTEADFINKIHFELMEPGTCALGYNTLRFDDEVIRHSLYRNFYDPYAREWQNGNSRWDLIDVVRLCASLRPEGIHWPRNEEGYLSLKLEYLTKENHIDHGHAHDALSDVRATIALARLIKTKQPKLYQYAWENRTKNKVSTLLNVATKKPVLHISGMFSAKRYCTAAVVPVARHPENKNGIIVFDLTADPSLLHSLTVDEIRHRLFTTTVELETAGMSRIPLKTIHLNRCPVIVPWNVMRPQDQRRLGIDDKVCKKHYDLLFSDEAIASKIAAVFSRPVGKQLEICDPDLMLYSGGFFSTVDRKKIEQVRTTAVHALGDLNIEFQDVRLKEMLFRYRARNWPDLLNSEEKCRWDEYRCKKLLRTTNTAGLSKLELIAEKIEALKFQVEHEGQQILEELQQYTEQLEKELSVLL